MQRIPEPELMNDPAQAAAYAAADFAEPHNMFVKKFREVFPDPEVTGKVLDLGCGPADVSIRFAKAYPQCRIDGVDGAVAMLREGAKLLKREKLADRIQLIRGLIPEIAVPEKDYGVIISNSLLHHLHDPSALWKCIKKYGRENSIVFVMDLMRPANVDIARALVNTYSCSEPRILKEDFYHSLCAAFTPAEVREQLATTDLDQLKVSVISDRHLLIYGKL
jgi:ubiquinone/menaquinone biosynthesis C-methylase UbiE